MLSINDHKTHQYLRNADEQVLTVLDVINALVVDHADRNLLLSHTVIQRYATYNLFKTFSSITSSELVFRERMYKALTLKNCKKLSGGSYSIKSRPSAQSSISQEHYTNFELLDSNHTKIGK